MFDVITFGSATRDTFLKTDKFIKIKNKKFATGNGICFSLGSKVDVSEFTVFSGGGGTNSAVTFANQGFNVAYCGSVGKDYSGEAIINELNEYKVDTSLVVQKVEKPTDRSVILNVPKQDRTALVYHGASQLFSNSDFQLDSLKAKWFYIAPLSGELSNFFGKLVNFAYSKGYKVAINPGNSQLAMPQKELIKILKKVQILILNHEEASFLTKISYKKDEEIFKKIDEMCPGISVITQGKKGAIVSDGNNIYKIKVPKEKIESVDRTGAGDSFGSGFVAGYMLSEGDIESSLQLAMANSIACLSKIGAKQGLLKKNNSYFKAPVFKNIIKNN